VIKALVALMKYYKEPTVVSCPHPCTYCCSYWKCDVSQQCCFQWLFSAFSAYVHS